MQDYESGNGWEENAEKSYLLRGALGALIGGLIGAIPWAIAYYYGWYVGYLGLLIGFLAFKGYALLGGKVRKATIPVMVIIIIFSVFVGQLLGDLVSLFNILADEGIKLSIGDIPNWLNFIFSDSDYIAEFVKNMGMGLLFALLGTYGMFKEIFAQTNTRQAPTSFDDTRSEDTNL